MNKDTIAGTQQQLIDEFNYFDNWLDRYEYIIELGRNLSDFPEHLRTETNRVSGCQAQVWLHTEQIQDKLYFTATSDALLVKGLIAILLRLYSGKTPQEIVAAKTDFIGAIGLDKHLSPTRSNGLYSMLQKMHQDAARIMMKSA